MRIDVSAADSSAAFPYAYDFWRFEPDEDGVVTKITLRKEDVVLTCVVIGERDINPDQELTLEDEDAHLLRATLQTFMRRGIADSDLVIKTADRIVRWTRTARSQP